MTPYRTDQKKIRKIAIPRNTGNYADLEHQISAARSVLRTYAPSVGLRLDYLMRSTPLLRACSWKTAPLVYKSKISGFTASVRETSAILMAGNEPAPPGCPCGGPGCRTHTG